LLTRSDRTVDPPLRSFLKSRNGSRYLLQAPPISFLTPPLMHFPCRKLAKSFLSASCIFNIQTRRDRSSPGAPSITSCIFAYYHSFKPVLIPCLLPFSPPSSVSLSGKEESFSTSCACDPLPCPLQSFFLERQKSARLRSLQIAILPFLSNS